MENENKQHPYCYAVLEKVFPKGRDGLRHTPERCGVCVYKIDCLREAMQKKEGLEVKEEVVDRAYSSGVMGFFERWSRKKDIQRRREAKNKTK